MKRIISELSDMFPHNCFRNWLRPHDLLLEQQFSDGARKMVCFHCGLAFADNEKNNPVVWDAKFEAAVQAYKNSK